MTRTRLLDLTRSMRRSGGGVTGIDRVERAYLSRFLRDDVPVFGLIRSAFGYLLLDRSGLQRFEATLDGRDATGPSDLLSLLPFGRNKALTRAETAARRLSVMRGLPWKLPGMLRHAAPDGFDYYNVGHSNLTDRVLRAVAEARGHRVVMIHDVIPLDFPQFQKPGTVPAFERRMRRVAEFADRVIYNSDDTRHRAERWFGKWGRPPPAVVAHLGVVVSEPDAGQLPAGFPLDRPFFVTLGTIEPRKNHAFLLDLWERMGPEAPKLVICGSRGWNNEEVFARLDQMAPDGAVIELPGLSDAAVAALLAGSAGALFPTHAEGFCLPAAEARALGTRVLCNDLPVLHEVLGQQATFYPVSEPDFWLNTIEKWEKSPQEAVSGTAFNAPTWSDHFKIVLRLT